LAGIWVNYSRQQTNALGIQASDEVSNDLHNPTLIWGGLSCEPIEIITIPSNHYTIITKPHIQVVVEQLNVFLNQT
jgi:thioesterase domain-containing protein